MQTVGFKNDGLGVEFDIKFDVISPDQISKRDIYDAVKTVVPPQDVMKLWGGDNPDPTNEAFVIDAYKNGYFDTDEDVEFWKTVGGAVESFATGIGKHLDDLPLQDDFLEAMEEEGLVRIRDNRGLPSTYQLYRDARKMSSHGMSPASRFKFDHTPQEEKYKYGVMGTKDRLKIDKVAMALLAYKKEHPEYVEGKRREDLSDGDYSLFKFAKEMIWLSNHPEWTSVPSGLDPDDEQLQREVLRRAYELHELGKDADFASGLGEWAGGYGMLGNLVSTWTREAGNWAGFNSDTDAEDRIELDYIKENFKLAKVIEDAPKDIAQATNNIKLERALADELVKVDPDKSMVISFLPDIPVELATMGVATVAQAGVGGVRQTVIKGQLKVLEKELMATNKKILEAKTRKLGYENMQRTLDNSQHKFGGAGNASGKYSEAQRIAMQKAIDTGMKKMDDAIEAGMEVMEKDGAKFMEKASGYSKPGIFKQTFGRGAQAMGISLDTLGRGFEYIRRVPSELAIDTIMKLGKVSDPARAETIYRQILTVGGAGGIATGAGLVATDQWDPQTKTIALTVFALLGPHAMQYTGTSLRHLGDHWVANQGSKNTLQTFQQLNVKNPKFSEIIIDRTDGASYSKSLGTLGQIFKRGETGKFMGKQGITRAERTVSRFLVDTGGDKALSFASRTLGSATMASSIPVGIGWGIGGEEGGAMALGVSLPFIGIGLATGEVIRHTSKHGAMVKQRGDVSNYRNNLSESQAKFYDRLSFENQAGLASAQMAFPDLQIEIVDKPLNEVGYNGLHKMVNGQSVAVINLQADQPLVPVLAHEIGHHIKRHGLTPMVNDIMFGDPIKGNGGIFAKVVKDEKGGWKYETEVVNGVKRYVENPLFAKLRKQYMDRLEKAQGIDEATRADYGTRENMVDEIFAEYVAEQILSQKARDAEGGLIRSLFHAMSGKPFLRDAGHNMGLFSDAKGTELFSGLPENEALNGLIKDYQKNSKRLSPEELQEQFPYEEAGEGSHDIIVSPAEQIANPAVMEIFNTGGIFKTDADGNILYGLGGRPKLMTKGEVDRIQKEMAQDLVKALEEAGDDLPLGHVTLDGDGGGEGMFLNQGIIDTLAGKYNASQIEFLRQVSNVGRKMASDQVSPDNYGNQAIMFYYSAMKHGGKYYRSLRGGYRNMYIYGLLVTKDANIVIRTVSIDAMDKNITGLMKNKGHLQAIQQAFGGTDIAMTRRNINKLWDTYYSNHAKGIKNGDPGSGITPDQRDWLNAFMGDTGSGNVDANPILSKLGKKKAQAMSVIRSRRLDRIGTIDFPGGGQDIKIRKIIQNMMPRKKNHPGQMDLDLDGNTKTLEPPAKEKGPTFWNLYGIDPKDPKRLDKVADVMISPGNRDMDGDIARDNHKKFGYTLKEFLDAMDRAHKRDEWDNRRFRKFLPANLGLKDPIIDGALPSIKQEKFSGDQLLSVLNQRGKEYVKDIGLDVFLQGKKSVTREDITNFVKENHLNFNSHVYGEPKYERGSLVTAGKYENYQETLVTFDGGGIFLKDTKRVVAKLRPQLRVTEKGNEVYLEDFLAQLSMEGNEGLPYGMSDDSMSIDFDGTMADFVKLQESLEVYNESRAHKSQRISAYVSSQSGSTPQVFRQNHWSEVENLFGHIRHTDRIIEGKDTRFIEELQGDWHQKLRKQTKEQDLNMPDSSQIDWEWDNDGTIALTIFKKEDDGDGPLAHFTEGELGADIMNGEEGLTINSPDSDVLAFWDHYRTGQLEGPLVPPAPMPKSWPGLLLKKAMLDAWDAGKRFIAWTNGKEHNRRYDLSNHLDSIGVATGHPEGTVIPEGHRLVNIDPSEGNLTYFVLEVDKDGKIVRVESPDGTAKDFAGKGLDEVVGKPMAKEIMDVDISPETRDVGLKHARSQEEHYFNLVDELQRFIRWKDTELRAKSKEPGYTGETDPGHSWVLHDNIYPTKNEIDGPLWDYYQEWLKDPENHTAYAGGIRLSGVKPKIAHFRTHLDSMSAEWKYFRVKKQGGHLTEFKDKDLTFEDPALPKFYDKELRYNYAGKFAKRMGVEKPRALAGESVYDMVDKEFDGGRNPDSNMNGWLRAETSNGDEVRPGLKIFFKDKEQFKAFQDSPLGLFLEEERGMALDMYTFHNKNSDKSQAMWWKRGGEDSTIMLDLRNITEEIGAPGWIMPLPEDRTAIENLTHYLPASGQPSKGLPDPVKPIVPEITKNEHASMVHRYRDTTNDEISGALAQAELDLEEHGGNEPLGYQAPKMELKRKALAQKANDLRKIQDHRTQDTSFLPSSSGFKAWQGDAKFIDPEVTPSWQYRPGEAVVVVGYHGALETFTEFDMSQANPMADQGEGIYMSNSSSDSSRNYADLEGGDVKNKIDLLTDMILEEKLAEMENPPDWYSTTDQFGPNAGLYKRLEGEARQEATKRIGGSGPQVYKLYAKFKNPAVLANQSGIMERGEETFFTLDFSDEDAYGGTLMDFLEGLEEAGYQSENTDVMATRQIGQEIMERAIDYEGIDLSDLIKIVDESAHNQDGSELYRQALENAGFDGIIDQTVDQKFGSGAQRATKMPGMNPDTTHFIAFKPNQVKSATGNRGTFDPGNPDIRYMPAGEFKSWFKDSKVVDEKGEPLVVYHGNAIPITEFKTKHKLPKIWNNAQRALGAHFFTPSYKVAHSASIHAGNKFRGSSRDDIPSPVENVQKVYLSIKNPKYESLDFLDKIEEEFTRDFVSKYKSDLLRDGHDGIIFKGKHKGKDYAEYAVFESNQIKSATGNRGTYDPGNPDIRYMPSQKDGKEIYQMSYDDFKTRAFARENDLDLQQDYYDAMFPHKEIPYSHLPRGHRRIVEEALKDGKDVHYEAVKDYPELVIRWMAKESREGREPKFMPPKGKVPTVQPSKHKEAFPVTQAVDKKGKPKWKKKKDANGKVVRKDGKIVWEEEWEPIDYNLRGAPLVQAHTKKTNRKKVPWSKLSGNLLDKDKAIVQEIYNTDLVEVASQKLADEYNNIWSLDPSVVAGKGWYSRMRKKLSSALGKHHEMFNQLLGATSAQTPVADNFIQAFDALEGFQAGRYDQLIKRYQEGFTALQKGEIIQLVEDRGIVTDGRFRKVDGSIVGAKTAPRDAFVQFVKHYNLVPLKGDGKKFNMNSGKVMQVLSGTWLFETQSPKTPNFAGNLTGRTLEATIDVWAGRYLRRMMYDGDSVWRIQPKSETGVHDADFALGQLIFREAGKKLNMNPDDLQAIAWFGEKGVWENSGWTKEASVGATKSSFDEAFDVFFPSGKGARTHEQGKDIMQFNASLKLFDRATKMSENPGKFGKDAKYAKKYLQDKTREHDKTKSRPNVQRFLSGQI